MNPPIPAISGIQVWNGIAVPVITSRHRDGTPLFGEVIPNVVQSCLIGKRCQLCGRHLAVYGSGYTVLTARPYDFYLGAVNEPAQHPVCAAYAAKACPMLSGRMERHRTVRRARRPCGDPLCGCIGWQDVPPGQDEEVRSDSPASPWFSLRFPLSAYRLLRSVRGDARGVSLDVLEPSRTKIRLLTRGQPDDDDLRLIKHFGLPWPELITA